MSDQTTESFADSGAADPSMEDILASIRRIIADDAVEDAAASDDVDVRSLAEAAPVDEDLNAVLTNGEPAAEADAALDFDDILIMDDDDFSAEDLEIPDAEMFAGNEADIAGDVSGETDGLDAEILEILESAELEAGADAVMEDSAGTAAQPGGVTETISTMPEPVAVMTADNTDGSDDLMSMFEGDIDLVLDMDDSAGFTDITTLDAATPPQAAEEAAAVEVPVSDNDDGNDVDLLGSILADSVDPFAADEAALEDLISDTDTDTGETAETGAGDMTAEDDLDLVKSLMADLTDEPLHQDTVTENTDAAEVDDTQASQDDDFLGDILELTMSDAENAMSGTGLELATAPEPASAATLADEPADEGMNEVDASINALLEIAASAEMDASDIETVAVAPVSGSLDIPEVDDSVSLDTDSDILDALDIDLEGALDLDAALFELDAAAEAGAPDESSLLVAPATQDAVDSFDIEALLPDAAEGETDIGAVDSVPSDNIDAASITDDPSIDDLGAIFETEEIEAAPEELESVAEENVEADSIESHPQPNPEQETEDMPQLVAKDGILDEAAEDASAAAFASLNQVVEDKAVFAERGPRVGDLVQDALRPMLKEWLDANLKGIVERAVAKEVKRISAGK